MSPLRHWLAVAALPFMAGLCASPAAADPAAEAPPLYLVPDDRRPIPETLAGTLWHDTEWGWIVTDSTQSAGQASIDLRAAIAAFYVHFGVRPERGAIIQSRYAGLFQPLKATGLHWQVPWRFAAATSGATDSGGHSADQRSALRHEIAHALFIAHVIPGTRKGQYGGDAPDWLDEAAAMTAETQDGAAARRRAFISLVRAGRLRRLSDFVAAEHPLFNAPAIKAALAEASRANPQNPVVLSFKASDIGVDRQAVGDFYAQSRAVFDFLQETSGDQRILATIAADFMQTRDPLSWMTLIEPGRTPQDAIKSVDAAFQTWSEDISHTSR